MAFEDQSGTGKLCNVTPLSGQGDGYSHAGWGDLSCLQHSLMYFVVAIILYYLGCACHTGVVFIGTNEDVSSV